MVRTLKTEEINETCFCRNLIMTHPHTHTQTEAHIHTLTFLHTGALC